jgi:hypothetical protein
MVKVGPSANFYARARAQAWDEEPEDAPHFAGIHRLDLHLTVHIAFVPDDARLFTALTTAYTVTPNERLAGTDEGFVWRTPDVPEDLRRAVFYVTPAEFARYVGDVAAMSETLGGLRTFVRVDGLRDHEVIRFVEHRILDSPFLRPEQAAMLERSW